jgi:hypothetical protein
MGILKLPMAKMRTTTILMMKIISVDNDASLTVITTIIIPVMVGMNVDLDMVKVPVMVRALVMAKDLTMANALDMVKVPVMGTDQDTAAAQEMDVGILAVVLVMVMVLVEAAAVALVGEVPVGEVVGPVEEEEEEAAVGLAEAVVTLVVEDAAVVGLEEGLLVEEEADAGLAEVEVTLAEEVVVVGLVEEEEVLGAEGVILEAAEDILGVEEGILEAAVVGLVEEEDILGVEEGILEAAEDILAEEVVVVTLVEEAAAVVGLVEEVLGAEGDILEAEGILGVDGETKALDTAMLQDTVVVVADQDMGDGQMKEDVMSEVAPVTTSIFCRDSARKTTRSGS